jgi:hypothetical protein
MNEFQKAQEEDDFKALKEALPSWMNTRVEPFIAPADSDVKVPVWGKTILPIQEKGTTGGGDPSASGNTFLCVIAVNDGGTFRPATGFVSGPINFL